MKSPRLPPDGVSRAAILRRADQAVVAVLTLVALLSVATYWLIQGGAQGRLIEIDRATHQLASFEVDINEAEWPELSQLPEIGETLARRIVESRQADGRFADLEDLRRVRGIGPKTLERLKPYLRPIPRSSNVAAQ